MSAERVDARTLRDDLRFVVVPLGRERASAVVERWDGMQAVVDAARIIAVKGVYVLDGDRRALLAALAAFDAAGADG